ncbi:type VI secretion system protein ImpI [Escherichia coli]|nr:type VI secretion system protein ImpI [Escherichia coli]SQT06931.1 type VI secretion system protein ImpI [Escherichia coli]SQT35901.1 type VI secretion system protein ImpI [Escherichia coli]HCO7246572.1 type VI secretion system contractile sheath large subunit [Escherichia coli]
MLACNIADSFAKYRWCPNIIGPQSGGAVKDLPVHLFETMGQIQAKIPTEVLVTDRREFELAEEGFITLTMRKDSDNAAFFSANSVQKPKHFPGKDAETNYKLGTQLPYLFIINRLAHYIKVLQREQLGSWKERSDLERELNTWIRQYVADQENPPADVRSRKPLRAAKVEVMDVEGEPGWYQVALSVRPHFKFMGANFELSLVVRPSAPLSDPASNGGINTPFMDLPPIYASPGDRNDDVSAAEMAQRHLAVTPLLRGLGGSLTMSNSDDADDFLEEAGRTLQAAIKGLLDLQQQRNSLSDKHLRPLEDNPLRLNMDYATALDVMFAEGKSPVHLAAPAAVSESLRNVRHHEEANRAAIVESLRVLLDAFSPQNLLRRFVQYRRSHELRQPLDDAGAWQMYSHYYEELASDRQQGFEMLFNEVYAQVYDRVLREKQREPEA